MCGNVPVGPTRTGEIYPNILELVKEIQQALIINHNGYVHRGETDGGRVMGLHVMYRFAWKRRVLFGPEETFTDPLEICIQEVSARSTHAGMTEN